MDGPLLETSDRLAVSAAGVSSTAAMAATAESAAMSSAAKAPTMAAAESTTATTTKSSATASAESPAIAAEGGSSPVARPRSAEVRSTAVRHATSVKARCAARVWCAPRTLNIGSSTAVRRRPRIYSRESVPIAVSSTTVAVPSAIRTQPIAVSSTITVPGAIAAMSIIAVAVTAMTVVAISIAAVAIVISVAVTVVIAIVSVVISVAVVATVVAVMRVVIVPTMPSVPGASADEESADKPARSVIAVGCASVGRVRVISPATYGRIIAVDVRAVNDRRRDWNANTNAH